MATKLPPERRSAGLHHRVAAADDAEGAALGDLRPHPVAGAGEVGEGRRHVDLGQRPGGGADRAGRVEDRGAQRVEDAPLDLQRVAAGVEDLRLDLGERQRGEADRVGGGLAVDEELGERRLAASARRASPGSR